MEAGAVERIKELVLQVPLTVQSEMTACVAVLALSGMSSVAVTWSMADSVRRLETSTTRDGHLRGAYPLDQLA